MLHKAKEETFLRGPGMNRSSVEQILKINLPRFWIQRKILRDLCVLNLSAADYRFILSIFQVEILGFCFGLMLLKSHVGQPVLFLRINISPTFTLAMHKELRRHYF